MRQYYQVFRFSVQFAFRTHRQPRVTGLNGEQLTTISYRFVRWLQDNRGVFALHLEGLGFVWARNLFKSR